MLYILPVAWQNHPLKVDTLCLVIVQRKALGLGVHMDMYDVQVKEEESPKECPHSSNECHSGTMQEHVYHTVS